MSRLIDAEALLKLFDEKCARECDNCVYYEKCIGHQYCGLIDRCPTVDTTFREVVAYECGQKSVEERPKGKWIKNPLQGLKDCSVCHYVSIEPKNYCPNCGADMRGEEHGTDL